MTMRTPSGISANFSRDRCGHGFSAPAPAAENIERLAAIRSEHRGGHNGLDRRHGPGCEAAVEKGGIGLVWSPNFSVGVNVFMQLVAEASRRLARQPEYGAWAWEIHHATKKDAPSGTLLKLVEEMKNSRSRTQRERQREPRGGASWHARDRIRFGGGHDYAAAHGAKPGRIRAGGTSSCAMGGGEKRLVRVSRHFVWILAKSLGMAVDYAEKRDADVYRMWNSAGDSVSPGLFGGRSRRSEGWCDGRSKRESIFSFLAAPLVKIRHLTHEEHLRVVEITVAEAQGRASTRGRGRVQHGQRSLRCPANSNRCMSTEFFRSAPYYNKPTQEGLYRHYKAIAEAVSIRLWSTTCQRRTGVNIEPDTIKSLAAIENIVGVKEASGDISQMASLIRARFPKSFRCCRVTMRSRCH